MAIRKAAELITDFVRYNEQVRYMHGQQGILNDVISLGDNPRIPPYRVTIDIVTGVHIDESTFTPIQSFEAEGVITSDDFVSECGGYQLVSVSFPMIELKEVTFATNLTTFVTDDGIFSFFPGISSCIHIDDVAIPLLGLKGFVTGDTEANPKNAADAFTKFIRVLNTMRSPEASLKKH